MLSVCVYSIISKILAVTAGKWKHYWVVSLGNQYHPIKAISIPFCQYHHHHHQAAATAWYGKQCSNSSVKVIWGRRRGLMKVWLQCITYSRMLWAIHVSDFTFASRGKMEMFGKYRPQARCQSGFFQQTHWQGHMTQPCPWLPEIKKPFPSFSLWIFDEKFFFFPLPPHMCKRKKGHDAMFDFSRLEQDKTLCIKQCENFFPLLRRGQ